MPAQPGGGPRAGDRPRLVVLRALKLGDLLAVVPALRALARAFPDHQRVLAAPAWLAPLARHTGTVDEVVDTGPLAPLDPALHGADVAVNLHGRGPQSTALLAATRPRRLIAFAPPDDPSTAASPPVPDLAGAPVWRAGEHERHRWCRLLAESGIPADPADLAVAPPAVAVPGAGRTVLHPGASAEARRWPLARWAAVARAVPDPVLTGTAAERGACLEVAGAAGIGADRVLAGRTDLLQLLAVAAAAEVVVSGDTGTAHAAWAVGTPSVVLYGPVSPAEWGPPPGDRHEAIWKGVASDPLADDRPAPGLLSITVEEVLAAVGRRPATVRPGG